MKWFNFIKAFNANSPTEVQNMFNVWMNKYYNYIEPNFQIKASESQSTFSSGRDSYTVWLVFQVKVECPNEILKEMIKG